MVTPATNFPPDTDPLRDRLLETYADILARADQLIAAASRVPEQLDEEVLAQGDRFRGEAAETMPRADRGRACRREGAIPRGGPHCGCPVRHCAWQSHDGDRAR